MNPAVKRVLEAGLVRSGAARLARRFVAGRTVVLAYHNILPDDASPVGDVSLHLPRARFAAQLDELGRSHDVVPLEALWNGAADRSRRPRAAITFDDAYRGAVTSGLAEVVARGLSATVFVAPALVDGRAFWWDEFADPGSGVVPEGLRSHALRALRGDHASVRAWARRAGLRETAIPAYAQAAGEAELFAAVSLPGVTLASHSWSHANLARLDAPRLRDELTRPLEWLRERFGAAAIPWLAYPYGISSADVERAAADAGYRAALRVDGGWLPVGSTPRYGVPRLNIPAGVTRAGFALRASGLIGR